MRRATAELIVAGLILAAVLVDGPTAWARLARACQVTAARVGRVGIYAEARSAVLTSEGA